MADLPTPFTFLDKYEVKARLTPALLLVLPLIFPVRLLFPAGALGWLETVVVSVPLLYALSFVVRAMGRRIEPALWQQWGGPPSTRFCRWQDDHIGEQKKEQLHAAVVQHLRLELYSPRKERARPDESDGVIADAFGRVRGLLRAKDPNGLWSTHNAEYGFTRNLLACSSWGAVLSAFSALVCGGVWYHDGLAVALAGFVADLMLAVGFLVSRLWVLPWATKLCADRYAESAWEAFLVITLSGPTTPTSNATSPQPATGHQA